MDCARCRAISRRERRNSPEGFPNCRLPPGPRRSGWLPGASQRSVYGQGKGRASASAIIDGFHNPCDPWGLADRLLGRRPHNPGCRDACMARSAKGGTNARYADSSAHGSLGPVCVCLNCDHRALDFQALTRGRLHVTLGLGSIACTQLRSYAGSAANPGRRSLEAKSYLLDDACTTAQAQLRSAP